MVLLYLLLFLIGLCIGSFINVLLMRLDRKGGILFGRSECLKCHTQLSWLDLIPIVSYLILMGKCRYCKSKISPIYPTVELITALVVTSYFWVNGFVWNLIIAYHLALLTLLVSLIFFDFLYLILPDKIVFSLIGLALFYGIFFNRLELAPLLVTGFILAFGFGIIYLVSQGRLMGFGDVKLAFAVGLILGYPLGLFTVVMAIWSAALLGLGLILLQKATLKTALPFGSFLSVATIIFIIFGNSIEEKINTYKYFF